MQNYSSPKLLIEVEIRIVCFPYMNEDARVRCSVSVPTSLDIEPERHRVRILKWGMTLRIFGDGAADDGTASFKLAGRDVDKSTI